MKQIHHIILSAILIFVGVLFLNVVISNVSAITMDTFKVYHYEWVDDGTGKYFLTTDQYTDLVSDIPRSPTQILNSGNTYFETIWFSIDDTVYSIVENGEFVEDDYYTNKYNHPNNNIVLQYKGDGGMFFYVSDTYPPGSNPYFIKVSEIDGLLTDKDMSITFIKRIANTINPNLKNLINMFPLLFVLVIIAGIIIYVKRRDLYA